MMKLNLFIGIVAFLVVLPIVAAQTATLVSPSDNSVISGNSVTLNATVSNPAKNFSCQFYAMSTSTNNNTWTLLATVANTTNIEAKTTFDSSIIEDSDDYVFNVTCYNDTDTWNDDTNTGITVDNTVPQTPTSLSPSSDSFDNDGSVTFTATITDENTTTCTLYFVDGGPGSSSYTMTQTPGTSTCTKTLTNMPDQTYKWYVKASDGTNTSSASSTNILNVDVKTSASKTAILKELEKQGKIKIVSKENVSNLVNQKIIGVPLWIIVLVVIIVIVVAINKKS